jgi:uncharacterized protein YndB with AHSA1/START domain
MEEVAMKWVIRVVVTLVGLVLLSAAVLFAMGHRANAGRLDTSIEIQAPPATVWAWLNDSDKLKQWVSWLVEIRPVGPQTGVGAKEVWVMRDENNGGALEEVTATCTDYLPQQRIVVALSAPGGFDGDQTYTLADAGNGRTRLEIDGRFRFTTWLAQLMEPVITPSAEKKMIGDLARLKSLIESAK